VQTHCGKPLNIALKNLEPYLKKGRLEAGCDEAGRGCLAGPVVAAAVILNPKKPITGLNDSKQLSEKNRDLLRLEIEKKALHWAVGIVDPNEIDRINILNASFLAMHKAVLELKKQPEFLLIDGNRFNPMANIPHQCVIKGDGKYMSIAAASILAKTYRDEIMMQLHADFPHFAWNQNKGYPTIAHRNAVLAHGLSPHHRLTFRITDPQLKLQF
jgi:ribonuclease HII